MIKLAARREGLILHIRLVPQPGIGRLGHRVVRDKQISVQAAPLCDVIVDDRHRRLTESNGGGGEIQEVTRPSALWTDGEGRTRVVPKEAASPEHLLREGVTTVEGIDEPDVPRPAKLDFLHAMAKVTALVVIDLKEISGFVLRHPRGR